MLVALAGLPASGKSALARRLRDALDATLLDKDVLRAVLFERHVDYSAEQNDLVVDIAYRVAAYLHGVAATAANAGPGTLAGTAAADAGRVRDDGGTGAGPEPIVLIDGRTFSERRQVEALRAAAVGMGARLAIIECRCSEDEARRRLDADVAAGTHPAADRDFALYRRRRASAEPIESPTLVLDTGELSLDECARRALECLRSLSRTRTEAPR